MKRTPTKPVILWEGGGIGISIREFFESNIKIRAELESIREAKRVAIADAVGGSVRLDREKVMGGPGGNAREEKVIRYASEIQQLEEREKNVLEIMEKMNRYIAGLKKSEYRTILTEYYINGREWQDIAALLCYNVRTVQRKSDAAFCQLGELERR